MVVFEDWEGNPPAYAVVVDVDGEPFGYGFASETEALEVARILHEGEEGTSRVTVWRCVKTIPPVGEDE